MLEGLIKVSRLRFRLLVALFAMILLFTVLFSSYGIYSRSVELILEESMEEDYAIGQSATLMIKRLIKGISIQMDLLEQLPEVKNCENLENSVAFKAAYESLSNYIISLGRIDEQGTLVAGYKGDFESVEAEDFAAHKEFIFESLQKRSSFISRLRRGFDGKPKILISYPVFRQGVGDERSYSGILIVDMDPGKMTDVIKGMPLAKQGVHFVVVDKWGDVLAASNNHEMVGNNILEESEKCLECHKNNIALGGIIRAGGGSIVVEEEHSDGQLASYVKMSDSDQGWRGGVYTDYSNITEAVSSLLWYVILVTIVWVIILLPVTYLIISLGKKREEAEERAKYLEKEKKLLEKIREADREISAHNRELTILNELATEVNKTLVLQEVLSISLNKTIELTPFDSGGIYILDDREQVLRLREHIAIQGETFFENECVKTGQGLTGRVAEIREPVFCDSMTSNPGCELMVSQENDCSSYAGIPLMHGKELLGVMSLMINMKIHLDEGKQKWLKSIGSIIGMAIGNCLLYREVRDKAEEMGILYDVGRDLTSTIERPKLSRIVIKTLKGRLEYPACTLLLIDKEKEELYVEATSYEMNQDIRERRLKVGRDGVTGWVAHTKQTKYVPDVTVEERYIKGRGKAKSELAIPIIFGDELLGVIDFEKDVKDGFSNDEIRFLSLFANQLSVALYNVNMFEETLRMNEELNRVSELKSEFVSLVSHELRTPLTAIKSSIDIILLRMEETLEESVSYFLKIAKANVDRLSNMIDNILDISRIESGRMQFSFQPLSIKEPASKAINNITPLAVQKGLQIDDRIGEDLPEVYADSGKVEQVFTNLIGNAIKFTPKGGFISIEASEKSIDELGDEIVEKISNGHREFIQVTIQDTGPGIPDSEQEQVFRRFRRIESGGGKGTGLGLAISKYLVESHGGGIWVESEVGKGSSFIFLIPLTGDEEEPPVHRWS
jgi:signal transduction histidine kinase